MLKLSEKYKEFLQVKCKREFLEGTTAAGKTTVGIFKFMCMVADSDKKFHLIAGEDVGTVEKNVINSELGLLEQFEGIAEYYPKGKDKIRLPHLIYETNKGDKIIYVCGYGDKKRWKKVLGGQLGCVFLDEVNLVDMEFMREITHRCKYMLTTSNPDDPNLDIYKEFINKSRPIKKYEKDYPLELLKELKETHVKGWVHWYFTFYDNPTLTKEDIQEKIDATPFGTKMYKNKIQGLRGKSTGLVFLNFDRRKHCITKKEARKYLKSDANEIIQLTTRLEKSHRQEGEYFILFTAGLDTAYSSISPDTIAMSFAGITNKRKYILLDERVYNNANLEEPLAPSDTVKNFVDFLERNRKEWGLARNVFIDNADQATIKEFAKHKRLTGCIYLFNDAWKAKMQIIDRINTQLGWFKDECYFIVDTCTNYCNELDVYSWKEDKDNEPEDANDHMVNSCQYSWIPYVDKIGVKK